MDKMCIRDRYTNQAINILSFWRNSFTTLHQVNFLVETYEASENKESALMKKVGQGHRALSEHKTLSVSWSHYQRRISCDTPR